MQRAKKRNMKIYQFISSVFGKVEINLLSMSDTTLKAPLGVWGRSNHTLRLKCMSHTTLTSPIWGLGGQNSRPPP